MNNIQTLTVEEIMQKIKQEVQKRKNSINSQIEEGIIKSIEEPFIKKDIYEYPDFTKYHDEEFVRNCYRGLLNREPDSSGLNYYLSLLRSGKKSKSEIVSLIRYSKEGRKINSNLLGFKKRYFIALLYKIPILGYLSKWLVTFLTLPKLLKRLNEYENFTYRLYRQNIDNELQLQNKLNKTIKEFNNYKQEVNKLIETKANLEDLLKIQKDILEYKNELDITLNNIANQINTKIDVEDLLKLKEDILEYKKELNIILNNITNQIDTKIEKEEF